MSPEIAKTKWCPMARVGYATFVPSIVRKDINGTTYYEEQPNAGVAINRAHATDVSMARCLATECMMWRQHALDSDDGHCGLAGFAPHGG